jgi:hypothetical protein
VVAAQAAQRVAHTAAEVVRHRAAACRRGRGWGRHRCQPQGLQPRRAAGGASGGGACEGAYVDGENSVSLPLLKFRNSNLIEVSISYPQLTFLF